MSHISKEVAEYLLRRDTENKRHAEAWEALRQEYHAMTREQRLEADLATFAKHKEQKP